MEETYLEESDTLLIEFNKNYPFQRIHPAPGLTVILDESGNPCGIELENVSNVLGDMEYLMVQQVDAIEGTIDANNFKGFEV